MPLRAAGFLSIAAVCLMLLASGASTRPLGIGYLDYPVTAQDEAVYSHAAIAMVESGDWSTPTFLDRYFLYKPPLLYWLSGASANLFGVSAWALRLPSMLAAALTAGLVFLWLSDSVGWWRAFLGAALLMATPLFRELGSRNMTDALVMAAIVTPAWRMARGAKLGALPACIAAGILAKSLAGLIPILILGVWWLGTREKRPSAMKIAALAALGPLIAAPWFLFQWETHRRWFEAEFIGVELLAYGASSPPQTNTESAGAFYFNRLLAANPALLLGFLFSLPPLWKQVRLGAAEAVAVGASVAVMAAAIFSYQYRNATYLLPLIPLMAVAFARYASPRSIAFTAMLTILVGVFMQSRVERAPLHPGLAVLRTAEQLCDMQRGNELIVSGITDDFSISTLPLAKLRYAIRGAAVSDGQVTLDFRRMGIILPAVEFLDGPAVLGGYGPRLREWGLPNDRALGTVISWDEPAELARLVEASPDRDFLFARDEAPAVVSPAHRAVPGAGGAILLLANNAIPRSAPARRACRL